MTRAQIAMEFIILIGMSMILMAVFLVAFNIIIQEKNEQVRDELFMDLGESIQQELFLGLVLNDGYSRTFYIPPPEMNQSYERYAYTINARGGMLYLLQEEHIYSFDIPAFTGTFQIGENTLAKRGMNLYVNS
ncbi:MAG: hypothetical protein ABIJ21_00525 [Nanoarchaeota archaeon]